jgi:hypothetical protein
MYSSNGPVHRSTQARHRDVDLRIISRARGIHEVKNLLRTLTSGSFIRMWNSLLKRNKGSTAQTDGGIFGGRS